MDIKGTAASSSLSSLPPYLPTYLGAGDGQAALELRFVEEEAEGSKSPACGFST